VVPEASARILEGPEGDVAVVHFFDEFVEVVAGDGLGARAPPLAVLAAVERASLPACSCEEALRVQLALGEEIAKVLEELGRFAPVFLLLVGARVSLFAAPAAPTTAFAALVLASAPAVAA
jgi:hypothetical protein